jgi:hypothetical protein
MRDEGRGLVANALPRRTSSLVPRPSSLLLLIALLATLRCASDPALGRDMIEGGPGQPISVAIGGVASEMMPTPEGAIQQTVQIEVSNNSDGPITVTSIKLYRDPSSTGAFQLEPTSRSFNELIDPNKDHLFDVPTRGRLVRPWRNDESRTVTFRVAVVLASGETYLYTFEGPVHG